MARHVVKELLIGSSSSSSSSSDEEDNFYLSNLLPELYMHQQKNENYSENIIPAYTDEEFRVHFKVPRSVLNTLAEEFSNSNYYSNKDTGFSRIPPEKCMWVFCWYATHEAAGFRDVADRFDIALSTLHLIIENVSQFISNKSINVITWPTEEEKVEISADFARLGFPDVIGCMDGSHVRIDTPANDPDSYRNRKKYFSIQMQAVCDSKRRIRDIFIGYPGSVHDARVFRNSPLSSNLAAICGNQFILADSAYPCLKNLLTPYRDNGHLSQTEKYYNQRLSHCRVYIEHTFGVLKQRFRQLYHVKLRNIKTICHFIRACCVLHNLCLGIDEVEPQQPDEDTDTNDEFNEQENIVGNNYRNYIASMLFINKGNNVLG